MVYTCTLRGEVLEVHETLHGWQSTQHYYWYYNVVTWMRSLSGRKDARADYPMQLSEIRWVQAHYLPKAVVEPTT